MITNTPIRRREFLANSTLAAGAATVAAALPAISAWADQRSDKAQKHPAIDCHAHLSFRDSPEDLGNERLVLDAADRLGIDQLCCSVLSPRPATVERFRRANRVMAAALKRHPRRLSGYCFINPGWQREALEEIRRCVEQWGFIGVKLYNEHGCTPWSSACLSCTMPAILTSPMKRSRISPTAATLPNWANAIPRQG
jgi:uncharacterized protein